MQFIKPKKKNAKITWESIREMTWKIAKLFPSIVGYLEIISPKSILSLLSQGLICRVTEIHIKLTKKERNLFPKVNLFSTLEPAGWRRTNKKVHAKVPASKLSRWYTCRLHAKQNCGQRKWASVSSSHLLSNWVGTFMQKTDHFFSLLHFSKSFRLKQLGSWVFWRGKFSARRLQSRRFQFWKYLTWL